MRERGNNHSDHTTQQFYFMQPSLLFVFVFWMNGIILMKFLIYLMRIYSITDLQILIIFFDAIFYIHLR